MTAKEYLRMYESYHNRAERLRREYEQEAEMIEAITSPQGGDGMPHGSGVSSTVEARAVKLAERLTELQEAEWEALRVRIRVFRTIEALPERMGAVLYARYIELKNWDEVADSCYISLRTAHNIHAEALAVVDSWIKKSAEK